MSPWTENAGEDKPGEEELVLTMADGEWCRVKVEGERLFFTDYGHFGPLEEKIFRKLSFQQRMKPVQVETFHFKMPSNDQDLHRAREQLALHSEDHDDCKLLARIERIDPSEEEDQLDIVTVSFWRALRGDNSEAFCLSKII